MSNLATDLAKASKSVCGDTPTLGRDQVVGDVDAHLCRRLHQVTTGEGLGANVVVDVHGSAHGEGITVGPQRLQQPPHAIRVDHYKPLSATCRRKRRVCTRKVGR